MRLPFVSAERYRLLEHNMGVVREMAHRAEEQSRTFKALYDAMSIRYDRLLEKYDALKLRGAESVPRGLEPKPRPNTPSDEAIEAKVRQFGNSTRLRRMLADEQRRQRQANVDEETIAHAIMNWRDPDSDEDEVLA